MPIKQIEIDDLASIGVIQDVPPYQLPPEAWSMANNMRILDDGMRRLFGWSQVFGTPSGKPYFLMYVSQESQPWWLYANLTDMFVYDGSAQTHTNISKSAAAYHATDSKDFNGTIFGGTPIINTGADSPQFWVPPYSAATKMADLSNWPATYKCRVIRSFGPFLIALNVTPGGTPLDGDPASQNLPHRVMWSTEASPGTVPGSWDFTDTTKDAGRNDLPDAESGIILDGLGLQGNFYIYKESAVWRLRFIGGRFIFSFEPFLDSTGLLCTRAVCLRGDGQAHVAVSQDDMYMHSGNTAEPLLESRFKRYLFNQIDTTNYRTSFMMNNPLYDECWFCYPSIGASEPNRALIFNWRHKRFTEADIDFQCYSIGQTQLATGGLWSSATSSWAVDPNPWSSSKRRRVVIGNVANTKIHLLDDGTTRDTASFTGLLQRVGLAVLGRKRDGGWIVDFQRRKQVNRVWPKVYVGAINVRVGYQSLVNGPITWTAIRSFDPTQQMFVDGTQGSGRAVAIEFSAANDFRIDGYKLDLVPLGQF